MEFRPDGAVFLLDGGNDIDHEVVPHIVHWERGGIGIPAVAAVRCNDDQPVARHSGSVRSFSQFSIASPKSMEQIEDPESFFPFVIPLRQRTVYRDMEFNEVEDRPSCYYCDLLRRRR